MMPVQVLCRDACPGGIGVVRVFTAGEFLRRDRDRFGSSYYPERASELRNP
jgi:hypothetical protein